MRNFIIALLLGFALMSNTGCFLPIYSADPSVRTTELIYTSENLRHVLEEWQRIWFLDQPSHLAPYRTHGGII
ncbi:hypothetical protein C5Y96_17650 [Blastopirellula marina]|uniref:Uncharacterized protein n=3 Tax=Pirellulaceae TaxID=2691357 RepID=A0A7V8V9D6_9BACT|nr:MULTISPECIES: hypothetical protein [Pirellulaceae]MBA2117343.1 hypothetical protein [Bremerella alba]PQO27366.1 hypothetical protein C5Y96_17650 [Blastopirellula marina]QDU76376.1 hypothetical protein Pan97_34240 [Bremerella volcania]RCS47903.1 hypothetical protein DTL36_17675 [Bremerella cremea]WDI40955.1 hypothetical protein PSR63_21030 [Bremerella sp. P1]